MMNEAKAMTQEMLDQRCEFRELLLQELANARGGALVMKELVVVEQVNNRPIPSSPETIHKGTNDDLESYQVLEQPEVLRNNEPKGYCKYKDFTNYKSSSFNDKEDLSGSNGLDLGNGNRFRYMWLHWQDSNHLCCEAI